MEVELLIALAEVGEDGRKHLLRLVDEEDGAGLESSQAIVGGERDAAMPNSDKVAEDRQAAAEAPNLVLPFSDPQADSP